MDFWVFWSEELEFLGGKLVLDLLRGFMKGFSTSNLF